MERKSRTFEILNELPWPFYDICLVTQIIFLIRPDSKFQVCTQVIFPRRFPSQDQSWYQGKLNLGQAHLLSGFHFQGLIHMKVKIIWIENFQNFRISSKNMKNHVTNLDFSSAKTVICRMDKQLNSVFYRHMTVQIPGNMNFLNG